MNVIIDIETDKLINPQHIWVIVCKDYATGKVDVFRRVTEDEAEKSRFLDYAAGVSKWIGHNIIEFDCPTITRLLGYQFPDIFSHSLDTLILSRLVDYSRTYYQSKLFVVPTGKPTPEVATDRTGTGSGFPGLGEESKTSRSHSIEAYGEEFNFPKIKFSDFSQYSQQMEDYCVRDVEICARICDKYRSVIDDPSWHNSILLEHQFQRVVNDLHNNGFAFNSDKATRLLDGVSRDLQRLDQEILTAFPPKEKLLREFTPKLTKFGTISRTSVPRSLWINIPTYEAGQTYRHTRLEPFNPASHKQVIAVLNSAGWKPVDKTQSHIDTEREL